MGMTARETLQALLDGKIIIGSNGYLWKLDENDELVQRKPKREIWGGTYSVFNGDCEIYKEYPLTFEQALRAMLGSKVVMPEAPIAEIRLQYRFNCERSCFEYRTRSDGDWKATHIGESEQKSMWKVVE